MADTKVSALGTVTNLATTDWLLVTRGSSSNKIAPPAAMTAAEFDAGTETGIRFAAPSAFAKAARWMGAAVANTAKRVGEIFTTGGGTYILHTAVGANNPIATAVGAATRIDRPPNLSNSEITTGTAATRGIPTAAGLKLSVDTHAPAAIRSGASADDGIMFNVISQTNYDALTFSGNDATGDANTFYIINA